MDKEAFKKWGHKTVDWIADYFDSVHQYPVKSNVDPGDILQKLPEHAPAKAEAFDAIWKDFNDVILPGITHWQSPNFFAYFPANNSFPSILGEMIMSAMGAQCMIWETSPAAAELEERVLDWLKPAMGIPANWSGVIQDTASTATLAAILSAREKYSNYEINKQGFSDQTRYRVYCSTETHSSIEKGVKIAGLGKANLVKIEVDDKLALKPEALKQAIKADMAMGFIPICVVSAVGTTGTVAIDPVNEISKICREFDLWHHIDAAYAGTALLLPEYQHWIKGIDLADSFVFNPHKWMFVNFDCTAYYVKDKDALIRTFDILPEYLKTSTHGQVNDYRDWGIPLGRRFRALKLWFVIRSMGLDGIREKLRFHIELAKWMVKQIDNHEHFEMLLPREINMLVFRYAPADMSSDSTNKLNEAIIKDINDSGKAYFTHTKVAGKYAIRMPIGQTNVQKKHIEATWNLLQHTAKRLRKKN